MHFLRFSTIVNAQTVYYNYVTNNKWSKNVRVIRALQGCRDWFRAVFCHAALAKYIVTSQMRLSNMQINGQVPDFFFNLLEKSSVRRIVTFFPGFVKNFKPWKRANRFFRLMLSWRRVVEYSICTRRGYMQQKRRSKSRNGPREECVWWV